MRNRRALLCISIAASILYLLLGSWQSFGRVLIKGSSVGGLALLAARAPGPKRDARLLSLGLALSTAGDVVLDLSPGLFVYGLGAFLLAHISYIGVFFRHRMQPFAADRRRVAAVVLVVLYSGTLSVWIVPSVGGLAVPVVLYVGAITVMVSTAILAQFEKSWVAWGALLFLISDSLLAIHKFKTPVPLRDPLVWATYYLAQLGITLGVLAGE